ncbi:hypothetical protein [Rhizobium sp. RAF56]|jgi:hypothetical protein|uniref:hypothetical protein n=1 Tax=Rhizobium sp. RAF56 TaxID=3233062 RepID=UPI003F9893C0
MDFIERWFGLSPDGGDGSTELLIFAAVIVVLSLLVGRRYLAKFGNQWRNRKD